MQLEKSFDLKSPRDEVVAVLCRDETLIGLLGEGDTELVESRGDRRTTRTRYRALGREGVATFHFTYLLDGNVRFEKVCDGNVWRELRGEVTVAERGDGARVTIEMTGRTKTLVPEFTIRGPMEEQLQQMSESLLRMLAVEA
jgi:carbon monoxide dehydrogenase subunit G